MSTKHLRNITTSEFKIFLELVKCTFLEINSGHEKWTRIDLRRPIIFQTHIEPIPEFILQNNLRILGYTKKNYFEILDGKKIVLWNGNSFILSDSPS